MGVVASRVVALDGWSSLAAAGGIHCGKRQTDRQNEERDLMDKCLCRRKGGGVRKESRGEFGSCVEKEKNSLLCVFCLPTDSVMNMIMY